MNELLSNRILVIPIGIWFLSQVLKVVIGLWIERRLNPQLLFTSGGMPSSHSALVASVTTAIAHETGVDSPLFGAAAVFSAIIMYDAAGVRRTVGTHARILNLILDELLTRRQLDEERLREPGRPYPATGRGRRDTGTYGDLVVAEPIGGPSSVEARRDVAEMIPHLAGGQ